MQADYVGAVLREWIFPSRSYLMFPCSDMWIMWLLHSFRSASPSCNCLKRGSLYPCIHPCMHPSVHPSGKDEIFIVWIVLNDPGVHSLSNWLRDNLNHILSSFLLSAFLKLMTLHISQPASQSQQTLLNRRRVLWFLSQFVIFAPFSIVFHNWIGPQPRPSLMLIHVMRTRPCLSHLR